MKKSRKITKINNMVFDAGGAGMLIIMLGFPVAIITIVALCLIALTVDAIRRARKKAVKEAEEASVKDKNDTENDEK